METVNPNLKSCLNDEEVVVKSRTTKVVDKTRQTTLVSPNVQGAKKHGFEKVKKDSKQNKPQSVNVAQQLPNAVMQTFPNFNTIIPTVFPQQNMHAPLIPFVPPNAPQNQIADPYTQQVYVPALIPVPAANANINQPLTYIAPVATSREENVFKDENSQVQGISDTDLNRFNKDDKYHSSELDYFLGGAAQYLSERSHRKRSRSYSSHSSSVHTRSSSRDQKRKRYRSRSTRSRSRSGLSGSGSFRSYHKYKTKSSGRHSRLSRSRSISFQRSRSFSRSLSSERSWSGGRSYTPPRAFSDSVANHERSPVSDRSFRGSFLTISEASSRDSFRRRSREERKSPHSDNSFSDPVSSAEYRAESRHRGQEQDLRKRDSLCSRNNSFNSISMAFHDSEYMGARYSNERQLSVLFTRSERLKPEGLERVSDFEDVSDFEEVSELEDISDSDTSITWQDEQKRSHSHNSGTYYETVSDNEEVGDMEDPKLLTNDNEATGYNELDTADADGKYDGYLDPRIEKPKLRNDFEDVSDEENETHFDSSRSPVKRDKLEKMTDTVVVESAVIDQEIPSSQMLVQSSGTETTIGENQYRTLDHETPSPGNEGGQVPTNTSNLQPESKSAVKVYENLGLIKDENNKFIYIGQASASHIEKEGNPPAVIEAEKAVIGDENMMQGDSLIGYVKPLWQFPHKGILQMSFTDFKNESEAYQYEVVAEIIHIILSLDLPYVTLNKLQNVIREKVGIKMISSDELRQILELYPKHFILTKHSGSDSDDDDYPDSKTSAIRVSVTFQVRLCERHKVLPFSKDACCCGALHVCPFYLLKRCPGTNCNLGHDLRTPHNANVMKEYRLHRSGLAEIVDYLRNMAHRGVDTVPAVCKFYNRRRGCAKEAEIDSDEMCTDMHVCFFYLVDNCRKGTVCGLNHSIMSGQPLLVLQKYGLDPKEHGEFNILSLIRKYVRIRQQELEDLHDKLSNKTLTENEIKLCVAKGINLKLLQMKHVKIQHTGQGDDDSSALNITNRADIVDKASCVAKNSASLKTAEEHDTKSHQTTKVLQMKAQKILVERALTTLKGAEDSEVVPVNKISEKKRAVIPIICKFYNNETGCARSSNKCEFIHVCHHYVMGDCKYNEKCKRSHDLTSSQPEAILSRLGLINKTEDEVLAVLRKLCGKILDSEERDPSSADS